MGVASAPVTDWKYYDTVYTERFMGTPQDNEEGYEAGSVFKRVHGLQGKPLLLAHGTGDDNVHFQNSVMLINSLIADSNQDFDVAICAWRCLTTCCSYLPSQFATSRTCCC